MNQCSDSNDEHAPHVNGYIFPYFLFAAVGRKAGYQSYTCFLFGSPNFPLIYKRLVHTTRQLAILNGSSAIGRIVPNLVVNQYGVTNAIVICSMCCAILIFCILAVKGVVGIILFGSIYGFFTGACAHNTY